MSTIDDVNKALKSLENLPNYCLKKVKQYCPVDNNVDVPPRERLRPSFHVTAEGPDTWIIHSECPYLPYVVHGRGSVYPKYRFQPGLNVKEYAGPKHLRWNAFGHGNGRFYESHGGTGYYFSGYAKATGPNPFVDRAYEDIVSHIERMGLKELSHELEVYGVGDFFDYEAIAIER